MYRFIDIIYRFIALLWFVAACFAIAAALGYAHEGNTGMAILWGVIWFVDCGLAAFNMTLADEEN